MAERQWQHCQRRKAWNGKSCFKNTLALSRSFCTKGSRCDLNLIQVNDRIRVKVSFDGVWMFFSTPLSWHDITSFILLPQEEILQQSGEIMKERLILKCDQVPRVIRSAPHTRSWNNSWYSGPWFHIMPTALPGNPAGSHHRADWPSGDSRTDNTTYNVAATTSFSNLGGFLRDPNQSTDQISSAWHFCLDELADLGGMAPSHHFHYAVISFLHRFYIISMVESLFSYRVLF